MRLLSDAQLARLAATGSTRAFAALYERHHQALYRYCLSIVRNPEDAQDALQSALGRAFAALRGRERDLAVRPWLFRIAHNEAVSILRRRRPAELQADEPEPTAALDVEGTVDQRERLATLVADLQALPLRQRSALVMRELSGLSIDEIAAALSMSPGVARQTLFEARSSLHAFAEGRAMECEQVRQAMTGDARVLRGRKLRAHLRACSGCREFRAQIEARSADLHALAPALPVAASAATLGGLLAHGAGAGHTGASAAAAGGASAAAAGAAVSTHATQALLVKGLVGAALVAGATAGTVQLAEDPAAHRPVRPAAQGADRVDRDGTAGKALSGPTAASRRAARKAAAAAGADARTAAGALAGGAPHAAEGARKLAHGLAKSGEAAVKGASRRASGKRSGVRQGAGARSGRKHVQAPRSPQAKSRRPPPAKSPQARSTHEETLQGGSSGEAHLRQEVKAPADQWLQTDAGQPTASAPVTTPAPVTSR
jgi:RNA polymerase sigma factor (sigma-70 family)